MSRTFSPWEVEKQWLIHPSIHDQVPPGYIADFVCDVVREGLDLEDIAAPYDSDVEHPAYYPALMTALLLYAWCEGVYSSRKIAKACEQRVDFMALTAMERLDFDAVRTFRDRHAAPLVAVLVRFFRIAQRVGLPYGPATPKDDGEKTQMSFGRSSDPFEEEARRWIDRSRLLDEEEDGRHGPTLRGDEVPKWLPDKPKRVRKLRDARLAIDDEDAKRAAAARALADDDDDDDDDLHEPTDVGRAPAVDDDDDEPPRRVEEDHPLLRRRALRSRFPTGTNVPPPLPEPPPPPPPPRDHIPPGTRRPLTRAGELRPARPEPPPAPVAPAVAAALAPPARLTGTHQRPEPPAPVREAPRRDPHPERAHQRPEAPPSRVAARPVEAPRDPRSRAASSDTPLTDGFMVNRPEAERLRLIETVVATAMADGKIEAIEERRIDQLMRTLRLDPRSRQRIYAMMRAGVMPSLPTPAELPDYDVRLHIFEQSAVMALADGAVHPDEQRHLKQLAQRLELDIEDAKVALRRANLATGG